MNTFTLSITKGFSTLHSETDDLLKKHLEVTWDADIDTVLFNDFTEKFLAMYHTVKDGFYGY